MKKNKISKNWLIKQNKDPFFRQSKIQGYRSRSAFKLIEINKKFKFIKKNSSLLDLGSCPGGWSQVARKEIIKGKILAVDVIPMKKINNVDFINGDFCEVSICKKIMLYFNNKIDVVLSDMAVNTRPAAAGEGTPSKKFIFHVSLSSITVKLNLAKRRAQHTV